MRPSYFASILLRNMTFVDARRAYVEWIVGAGRFDRLRSGRDAVGIDTRWPMRELHEGTTLVGRHDARVATRRSEDQFLLHLTHRDAHDPSVLWHNVVELRERAENCAVSHASARSGPPGVSLPPTAGAPNVLRLMLKWNGHAVEPADIGDASLIRIEADTADGVIDHLILSSSRTRPLLLVTPQHGGGRPSVEAEKLANRLAGMARVLVAADDAAVRATTLALQGHGFPRQFATIDGGVRVFFPNASSSDSPYRHPLWTRARIEAVDGDRTERIAGEVAEALVRGAIPRGFFHIIEEFDATEARERIERLLDYRHDSDAQRDLDSLRADHAVLRNELGDASRRLADLASRLETSERERLHDLVRSAEIEQERDEMRDALQAEQAKSVALEAALRANKKGAAISDAATADRNALRAVTVGRPSPGQCLRALEIMFGDRVIVLPSAHSSAAKAADFRYGDELWRLLTILATDYRTKMIEGGGGDSVARAAFGSKFAAKESETTMSNAKAKAARTFEHDGETYVMWRHLKHGVDNNTVESVRVHFEWLGSREQILLGHCGEHLYLPLF